MKKYIGYRDGDRLQPWAKFFLDKTISIHPDAAMALGQCPMPKGSIPPIEQANTLVNPGYADVETGYTIEADGSIRVAIHTQMPRVSPAMWDWWFGWHGSVDSRYKLWHPKSHRAAAWQDGRADVGYIGRVSQIEEYIGTKLEKANIAFQYPASLGFSSADMADKTKAVFICARVGYTQFPIDFGWLVHQIRSTADGAEMRSRFWMGGQHIAIRGKWAPSFLSQILQKSVKLPEQQAIDLLTHCSEEMNHLASFLPELYHTFQNK